MKKIKITAGICLTLFIIYIIFGFFGAPYIIKNILPSKLEKNNINFQISQISFNPLSLELNASGVKFATSSPIFEADKIYLNLAFLPILQKTIEITSFQIQNPQINIKLGKNSNISPFLQQKDSPSSDKEPSGIKIKLHGLNIQKGNLSYGDDNNALNIENINYQNSNSVQELIFSSKGVKVNLNSINLGESLLDSAGTKVGFSGFEISDELAIKNENNKININVGKIAILGLSLSKDLSKAKADIFVNDIEYELDTSNNQNKINIKNLSLNKINAQNDKFNAQLNALNISQIFASTKDSIDAQIGKIQANSISLTATKSNIANVDKFEMQAINFSKNILNINSASIAGASLFGSNKNGFSLLNISQISADDKNVKIDSIEIDKAMLKSDITDSGLSVLAPLLNSLPANQTDKSNQDKNQNEAINLKISNIALKNASVDLTHKFKDQSIKLKNENINLKIKDFSLRDKFSLNLNAKDELLDMNLNAKIQITPLKAELDLDAPKIITSPYFAYAKPFLNANIIGEGRLKLKSNITINGENYTLNTKANLSDIAIEQNGKKSIQVDKISLNSLDLTKDSLSVNGLKIASARANIIRETNGSLNLSNLIKNVGDDTKNNKKSEKPNDKFKLKLKDISLSDGKIEFHDETVGFKTQINDIDIKAVEPTSVSAISLNANANDAYLSVNGKAVLTNIQDNTDLKINLKNLNLVRLSPYSAKYIGKEIDKGLATLFTKVQIEKGSLNVSNELNLDNLTLGKSVQSKDATSLPVDMALAILRDFKNQININLPISASVNDPNFHFGGVIFQAITQLITDVVFSPFKFIGKALGMDTSKLSAIDFTVGSSEMLASESEKASEFKKIAEEKGFKIIIYPGFNQNADAKAIALNKLGNKATQDELESMIKNIDIASLKELAIERANAVKSMLLNAGINPDNVKINSNIQENAPLQQDNFIPIKMGISK